MKHILFIAPFLLLFVACSNNSKKIELNKTDSLRIVSLAQSISQDVEYLGLSKNIVGATSYCNVSKKNTELIIGSSTDINIEKILILKPSVVLASTLTQPNIIESLKKNNIKVHCMGKASSFEEICNEFIKLGSVLGKKDTAAIIVSKCKNTIDSLRNNLPKLEVRPNVFFQIGSKPLFSVIPNTYMNDYLEFANCKNIASDLTSGTITREAVIKRNPDIIFVVTMGVVGNEEVNIWKTFKQINAVKNNRIYILDSDIACAPTPITFVETFQVMIKNIYENK